MTVCYHQKCNRQDLPYAVGYPKPAKIPPAHVRPDGEPCEPPGTYPFDVVESILDDDDSMWDLDSRTELEVPPPPAPEKLSTRDQALVTAALKNAPVPEREDEAPKSAIRATLLPEGEDLQTKKPARKRQKAPARKPEAPSRGQELDVDDWDP